VIKLGEFYLVEADIGGQWKGRTFSVETFNLRFLNVNFFIFYSYVVLISYFCKFLRSHILQYFIAFKS